MTVKKRDKVVFLGVSVHPLGVVRSQPNLKSGKVSVVRLGIPNLIEIALTVLELLTLKLPVDLKLAITNSTGYRRTVIQCFVTLK